MKDDDFLEKDKEASMPSLMHRCSVRTTVLAGLLAVALSLSMSAWSQEDARVFRAGAAMSNITPPIGVSLAGSMAAKGSTHIHDELYARCLVLEDGETRVAIVLVDNCVIPREVFDEAKALVAKATGIPPTHQLMAATHSHSAPTTTCLFQNTPNEQYLPFLVQRIADGVRRAVTQLEPARIARGSASLPEEVFNRRWFLNPEGMPENPFGERTDKVKMNPARASEHLVRPAGPIDPEIAFLAVESTDGRPIALLANYSLHYVGGVGGGHVSADYFAIFADRIQELLGADRLSPPFVGIMSNGTSGDINNINFTEKGQRQAPYEQMTHVGRAVAQKVYEAYSGLEWCDWAALDASVRELELGVRKPEEAELARAREIVSAADNRTMTTMPEIYAWETLRLDEYPDTVRLLVQAVRVGDLAIGTIPCEAFAEIGLHLKAESPFAQTFTIELANGYNGYLPTPAQHELGGYETWRARSSYLEVTASDAISAAVLDLFQQLHGR